MKKIETLDSNQLDEHAGSGKIEVGISACLLGMPVRYNGGHSQSKLCLQKLSSHFDFKSFCPEVAAGFSVPRPTMRLIGNPDSPTLTYSDDHGEDLTETLKSGFQKQLDIAEGLHGYILMKNSPSCGMERIKVYQETGYPHEQKARGIFAEALIKRYPQLPVEEEGRLNDAPLRENFIGRVYVHHNFQTQVMVNPSYHKLLQFHSSYKYFLMAHSQRDYRELGQFLAVNGKREIGEVCSEYFARLMSAIAKPAKRKGHVNVLQHIVGYLKRSVPSRGRNDILRVIEQYRKNEVNLATPLTLLAHYVDQNGNDYIRSQKYFSPYPAELGLRNQI